jgi:translation initiation factor 4E
MLEIDDFVSFLVSFDLIMDEEGQIVSSTSQNLLNALLEERGNEEKLREVAEARFAWEWCIWLDNTKPGGLMSTDSFMEHLKQIGTFSSVASFCESWNELLKSDNVLVMYSNLRVFKNGIAPVWEHPENEKGGKWVIRMRVNFVAEEDTIPDEFVKMFLNLLIHMVMGQLGFEDEICGAQLSIRPTGLVVSVWNKNCNAKEQISFLTERLKEILQVDQISYASHANVIKNFHNGPDEHIHPPKRRNKRRTSNPDPPTQPRLSPNGYTAPNTVKNKPAFKGDGGGASWDDIISGAKPKSELVKLPTGNIVKKIKSYEDVANVQKSFSIKGEFSKSMGSVHHQTPQNYTPKNDAKSKIYWYYRRKELKALKNNMKKSASATSIPEIREPEFGIAHPPSPKKSPLVQRKAVGGGQKLLLQHIEEQQRKIQQQHRDQLDKQKQNAAQSNNVSEFTNVVPTPNAWKIQEGRPTPQESKSEESSPRKYDITKKPQANAPVLRKEKAPTNTPKTTHDIPVKSENLPVLPLTPPEIKIQPDLPKEEDNNIPKSPTTHPTVSDHVTKTTPPKHPKTSENVTKPTPEQTDLTHPTVSDDVNQVTNPTPEQTHPTHPIISDDVTTPVQTDLTHPIVSDHLTTPTPVETDLTHPTTSDSIEEEKNTIETTPPKETTPPSKSRPNKPSSKAQNTKHLASKSPNTNTTQTTKRSKKKSPQKTKKEPVPEDKPTPKVVVEQKDQTQTFNKYIIAMIIIMIVIFFGYYLLY